jgi:hypothetical protein
MAEEAITEQPVQAGILTAIEFDIMTSAEIVRILFGSSQFSLTLSLSSLFYL